MPACFISNHGRIDHDEYALLPMTRVYCAMCADQD
jgi:hypothetical protein